VWGGKAAGTTVPCADPFAFDRAYDDTVDVDMGQYWRDLQKV
jgi:hypothetical protein